jgi:hypothetical protein
MAGGNPEKQADQQQAIQVRVRCVNAETQNIASLPPPPDCCEFPFKFQLFFIVPIDVAAISVHSWPTMNRYTLLISGMKDKGE